MMAPVSVRLMEAAPCNCLPSFSIPEVLEIAVARLVSLPDLRVPVWVT